MTIEAMKPLVDADSDTDNDSEQSDDRSSHSSESNGSYDISTDSDEEIRSPDPTSVIRDTRSLSLKVADLLRSSNTAATTNAIPYNLQSGIRSIPDFHPTGSRVENAINGQSLVGDLLVSASSNNIDKNSNNGDGSQNNDTQKALHATQHSLTSTVSDIITERTTNVGVLASPPVPFLPSEGKLFNGIIQVMGQSKATAEDSIPGSAGKLLSNVNKAAMNLRLNVAMASKSATDEGICPEAEQSKPFHSGFVLSKYANALAVIDGVNPRILTCLADGNISIRHVYTGEEQSPLIGHTDKVLCISIASIPHDYNSEGSKYRRLIMSGCRDGILCIWDFNTLDCIHKFKGHKYATLAVVIMSKVDGSSKAVSASNDGIIRIWDGNTGEKVGSLKLHTGKVCALCLAREHGTHPLLLSGGADKLIRVWDLNDRKCIKDLKSHDEEVTAIISGDYPSLRALKSKITTVIPDSVVRSFSVAISASADLSIAVWDLIEGHLLYCLDGHTKSIQDLAFFIPIGTISGVRPDQPMLLSSSEDCTIRVWDLERRKQIKQLQFHSGPVRCVKVFRMKCIREGRASQRNLVATAGWDLQVKMFDLDKVIQQTGISHRMSQVCSLS